MGDGLIKFIATIIAYGIVLICAICMYILIFGNPLEIPNMANKECKAYGYDEWEIDYDNQIIKCKHKKEDWTIKYVVDDNVTLETDEFGNFIYNLTWEEKDEVEE